MSKVPESAQSYSHYEDGAIINGRKYIKSCGITVPVIDETRRYSIKNRTQGLVQIMIKDPTGQEMQSMILKRREEVTLPGDRMTDQIFVVEQRKPSPITVKMLSEEEEEEI